LCEGFLKQRLLVLIQRRFTFLDSVQVAALSNAAGVGGGAFFVPLFNLALDLSALSPIIGVVCGILGFC
jgi:hypothetical protein